MSVSAMPMLGDGCLFLLAMRDDDPGSPARGSSTEWKLNCFDIEAAAHDEPRDQGVGVPHLASAQLVTAPYGHRHQRHQIEEPPRAVWIIAEAARAIDRFGDVGDEAVAPAAHLVSEKPEPTCGACSNGTLDDYATLGAVAWSDRRHLDHETPFRRTNLQSRVIEVASISPFEPRRKRLEDEAVHSDRVTTCSERQPVQVNHRRSIEQEHRIEQGGTVIKLRMDGVATPRSGVGVSVLLRQPQGFEGILAARVLLHASRGPIQNGPRLRESLVHVQPASTAGAVSAGNNDDGVSSIYVLLGLDAEVLVDLEDASQRTVRVCSNVRPRLNDAVDLLPLEIRRDLVGRGPEVTSHPTLVDRSHRFHVLLRHRPRSIPRQESA